MPLATVQRVLRHTDQKITSEVYGYLDLEGMREGLNRLRLSPKVTDSEGLAASLLLGPGHPKREGPEIAGKPERLRGLQMVGATGFEPATTCTPKMPSGAAPDHTARIETQAPEIPAPPDQLPDAPGSLCAGSSTGNGAPVGRGVQHTSVPPPSLEDLYKRVRDAVARGDFDLARELIDEAARSGFGGESD